MIQQILIMSKPFIFSSESVTEGHPDKVCDTVSDAVLDACLEQDINSRVACETFVKDNVVGLAGEITTDAKFDYGTLVKNTLKEIGYDADYAKDTDYSYTCKFEKGAFLMNMLGQQSPDIAQGLMLLLPLTRTPLSRVQVIRALCLVTPLMTPRS